MTKFFACLLIVVAVPATLFSQGPKPKKPRKTVERKIHECETGILGRLGSTSGKVYLDKKMNELMLFAPGDGTGYVSAYTSLGKIELAKHQANPESFDPRKANMYLGWALFHEPDSPIGNLLRGQLFAIQNKNEQAFEYFARAFELNPFLFESYYLARVRRDDVQQDEKFLSEVLSRMQEWVRDKQLSLAEAQSAVEGILALSRLKADVSAEIELLDNLQIDVLSGEPYLDTVEDMRGLLVKQAHYFHEQGNFEKQLELLSNPILKNRLPEEAQRDITRIIVGRGEYSEKARAIFDPFARYVSMLPPMVVRIFADEASKSNNAELERMLRFQVWARSGLPSDLQQMMETHARGGQQNAWFALAKIDDQIQVADGQDSIPIKNALRSMPDFEITAVDKAAFHHLRGLLEMKIEFYGAAARSFQLALKSDASRKDSQELLQKCYERIFDDHWAGPTHITPIPRSVNDRQLQEMLVAEFDIKERNQAQRENQIQLSDDARLIEQAIQLIQRREVNRESKSFREAVQRLEKYAPVEKPGNSAAHLALASCEMRKNGRYSDEPFDAEYVEQHLRHCINLEQKESRQAYRLLGELYRKLQQPDQLIKTYEQLFQAFPTEFEYLFRLNEELNRRQENEDLLQQTCQRLHQALQEGGYEDQYGMMELGNVLTSLVGHMADPTPLLKIIEQLKERQQGRLSPTLRNCYLTIETKLMDLKADKEKIDVDKQLEVHDRTIACSNDPFAKTALTKLILQHPDRAADIEEIYSPLNDVQPPGEVSWLYLEKAIAENDPLLFETWILKFQPSLARQRMDPEQMIEFGQSLMLFDLSPRSLKSVIYMLRAALENPAFDWPSREPTKARLHRMLGLFLVKSGNRGEAIKQFEAVLEKEPYNKEVRKLLEQYR